jgi:K+-transporting ATPase ATPase C chain
VAEWCEENPDVLERWKQDNPKADEAPDPASSPDAVAVQFFVSFAARHPRKFPALAVGKVVAVSSGADLQGVFFDAWLHDHPTTRLEHVPADAVTASGAGLDPHITVRNARWQLDRVAAARAAKTKADPAGVRGRIEAILDAAASAPLGGLVGEQVVNVLEVNLRLDAELAGR